MCAAVQVPRLQLQAVELRIVDAAQEPVYQPSDAQLQESTQRMHQAAALLATTHDLVLGDPAGSTAHERSLSLHIWPPRENVIEAALKASEPLAPHISSVFIGTGGVLPLTPGILAAMAATLCNVEALSLGSHVRPASALHAACAPWRLSY